MNILPFVLAILLVLSYGTAASFQSRVASRRNQKAHLGLRNAELSLLRQSQKEHYNELPGTPVKEPLVKALRDPSDREPTDSETPKFNPACARLNLFPLLDEGQKNHPALYETAAKLLRTFYQKEFLTTKGLEYRLLDAIITAGKNSIHEDFSVAIETLDLKNPDLQMLYYTALKGTKKCTLSKKGFPPLIDYIKIERSPSPICLFDAHPNMLTVFFGPKVTPLLYEELHTGQKQAMELDAIFQLAADPSLTYTDPEVWKLLQFARLKHNNSKVTLVAEDLETGISLRKEIQVTHK